MKHQVAKRVSVFLLLAAGLLITMPLGALPKLSLEDFISKSVRNNPGVQKIKNEYAEQRYSARRARAMKDLLISFVPSWTRADPLKNNNQVMGSEFSSYGVNLGVQKKFPSLLGMSAGADVTYKDMSFIPSGAPTETQSKETSLSLNLTIPLLRNFLGKVDQSTLKSVSFNVKMLEKAEYEAYETFLTSLYQAYYDWMLLSEKVAIYKGFQGRAARFYNQTVKKSKVGMAEQSDVYLARQNYLQYRSRRMATEMQANQQYLTVKRYMEGKKPEKVAEGADDVKPEWEPLAEYDFAGVKLPGLVQAAATRVLQMSRLQLKMARLQAEAAASDARPDLNLVLKGGKGASGPETGDAFSSYDEDEFYAGLNFSMPLQNTDRGNKKKAAESGLGKAEKNYEDTEQAISYGLRNLRYSLGQMKKILSVNKNVVATSRARVAALSEQYAQGRATLKQVADARDMYANARITFLEQSIQLKKLLLEYESMTDRLYERHKKLFE